MRARWPGDRDDGYMTVVTAFAAAAVLAVAVAVLLVGRAAAAADFGGAAGGPAALVAGHEAADILAGEAGVAGAHALQAREAACAAASGVAAVNRAVVTVCTVDGWDVVVRAEVRAELGVLGARAVSAVARAGPV